MKLDKEEKVIKNSLIKLAKSYKDKSKLISAIDLLIDKDIFPSCIDIKITHKAQNGFNMDYDLIVYKNKNSRNNENIILVVKFIENDVSDKDITSISHNYFSSMPNLFFILFFNNSKKSILTFKNIDNDKMLINRTKQIPSFKWE